MTQNSSDLLVFVLKSNMSIEFQVASILVLVGIGIVIAYIAARLFGFFGYRRSFEIEEAEIGLGDQKITLRPNDTDRQIAYRIWVELSTRKVGIPIDLDDDVIVEIYDSWYAFFGITRELIKDVPVSKFRRPDTEKIIRLSMEVLNLGVRPHLTKWQARFRRWYEYAMQDSKNRAAAPQEVQTEFPKFEELKADMLLVNTALINYRAKLYTIVSGKN